MISEISASRVLDNITQGWVGHGLGHMIGLMYNLVPSSGPGDWVSMLVILEVGT